MTIISYLPTIWLAAILAGIFCEAYTEQLTAIWVSPAAAAALVGGLAGLGRAGQCIIFVTVLAVALIIRGGVWMIHKRAQRRIDIEGQTTDSQITSR